MDAHLISAAFSDRTLLPQAREAVLETLAALDRGQLRVAEKVGGDWVVHTWIKQADRKSVV